MLKGEDVFEIEYQMINAYGCNKYKNNDDITYHKISCEEANHKYGFNWKEYSKELGYKS